jgi:hypothetical protein
MPQVRTNALKQMEKALDIIYFLATLAEIIEISLNPHLFLNSIYKPKN